MASTAAVLLAFTLAVLSADARKLPSYLKLCKKSDPDFDGCLLNSLESLRPRLIKGIPKLQVPPIDPFILPALEVTRDQEAIKVRAHLTNIVGYGGKDFVINRLKTDLDKLTAEGTVTLPFIHATADYDVDGRILVAPFKGKGSFSGNFTGIKVDAKGDGRIVKRNGEDYFQINNLKTKIKIQDSNVKINQADDRNGALAQSAINFYNQNRQQVLAIIMPIVQETAEEIMIQMGNRILGSATVNEFLPA